MNKPNLPRCAIKMLKEVGLSTQEIKIVKEKHGGWGGCKITAFDEEWRKYCDEQVNYFTVGYKKDMRSPCQNIKALAELVSSRPLIARLKARYWKKVRKGKMIVAKYRYSEFIKYFPWSCYYIVNVRSVLGIRLFPSHRYTRCDKKTHKPGAMDLANLATAIKAKKLTKKDSYEAKRLAMKIYSKNPKFSHDELNKFKLIVNKAPNYSANGTVWHECEDGHRLVLLAAGKLHTGSTYGGLKHKGGHTLMQAAEDIIRTRKV
ncbi:MAG: hypothetical protein MdMp014T_2345 [Treponematales bacterium]